MANHGVFVSQKATSGAVPVVAQSGVPFLVGAAPVQSAETPGAAGIPILCTSWQEAVSRLGYSDDWDSYNICEFIYSHFQLFGCQPVIVCNLLDISSMKTAVPAADVAVSDHKAKLPIEAINDDKLVVKAAGGTGEAYAKGTDYSAYYDGEFLIIEALPDGACYSAESINAAYNKVTPEAVTDAKVAAGMEGVELCMTRLGIVPDLLCAPGFSERPGVAAVMATKAAGINGMFRAKALVDIGAGADGARTYSAAIAAKSAQNIVGAEEIACWPKTKLGDHIFHMSTQIAGLMAQVDAGNGSCPYESPSNKGIYCDALVLDDGEEVNLTLAQANILNANGIMTALNFMGGWTAWGNYTACYPGNTDIKDYFIPESRMFDWVGSTLIRTFWSRLDRPMTRRLIDTVLDTANIWLNSLVGAGYLLGGRVEMLDSENPDGSLSAGIMKLHVYLTPLSSAQEINFVLEYDAEYVASAFQA